MIEIAPDQGTLALPVLLELLETRKIWDSAAMDAVYNLGRIRPVTPAALQTLLRLLHHVEPQPRKDAMDAFGNMGVHAEAAVKPMLRILDDPDEQFREKAVRALAQIAPHLPDVCRRMQDMSLRDPSAYVRHAANEVLQR